MFAHAHPCKCFAVCECIYVYTICIGTPNPEIIISLDAGGRRVTVRVFHPRQNAAASYLTRSAQYTYTLYISRRLTNSVSLCPSLASRFMALIFILDALFTALSRCVGERVLQMKWWGDTMCEQIWRFGNETSYQRLRRPPSPVLCTRATPARRYLSKVHRRRPANGFDL